MTLKPTIINNRLSVGLSRDMSNLTLKMTAHDRLDVFKRYCINNIDKYN